ncbi:MAG: sigma-70 family RNA polymerase sigma factor [Verrucomicrobiota bacterium]
MPSPEPFPSTQWSAVVAISMMPTEQMERKRVDDFCRLYWQPICSFTQSMGLEKEDAEEVTQNVLSSLADPQLLAGLDPAKGRLRSFIRAVTRRKTRDFLRHQSRQKRGGDCEFVEFDDNQFPIESEQNFDRDWALKLLDLAASSLRNEYEKRDRGAWFEKLYPKLSPGSDSTDSQREIAEELEVTEASIGMALHRMKQKYQRILRDEVAKTVATPSLVEEELRSLYAAIQAI